MVKASVGRGFAYFFTTLFALAFILINLAGIFFVFTLVNAAFASQDDISQINKTCLSCHQEPENYLVKDSVHESLNCTVCHSSSSQFPHPSDINIAQEVQQACQACHANTFKEYAVSIHGEEKYQLDSGTTCISCHGSHDIFNIENPEAKHNRININNACFSCHDGRVLESYSWSFHGTAFNFGYTEAANCIDCHGSHDILPEDSPMSMVNIENRPETCAKCHNTARPNFAKGSEHVTPFDKENALPLFITLQIFIILILFDTIKDSSIAIFDLFKKLLSKKHNHKQHQISSDKDDSEGGNNND